MTDFLKLTKEAFEASTTYIDSNYRKKWDDSIRAFRNEHSASSKYSSEEYKGRSRIFRPKTRAIIRKNEAAGALALFSNREIVDVEPGNPDDVVSAASAAALKAILEYRLSKTIPTYQLVIGGLQDAQTTGTVCSYQHWEYENRNGKKIKDRPCIELRPVENLRLDAGASWLDPVNTSPYFGDIIPMYVCDVKRMMNSTDDKTGQPKWKKFDDKKIRLARPDIIDSTRKARQGFQQDPQYEEKGGELTDFDIVWVLRWFMKDSQGEDYTYYSLSTEELLTEPKPIDEVYFHGKRPYVIGCSIIETHKSLKDGVPELIKPMQQEINDVANQRLDNVKFVLNKRWIVARGRQTDIQSLVRNVPGGVTLTNDPKTDVIGENWADVTSSSYVEHDRLNAELDDLVGNFTPNTRVANKAVNDTLGGSRMANQSAGVMTDYLLRTVIETWWEPVLRQLVLLEQHYETDDVVLGVAAEQARLFPRFGISRVTDMLLMKEVNVSVNVGMGAANPSERFNKFMMASEASINLVKNAPPGFNVTEAIKEIYSNAGYRNGTRFWSEKQDPRLLQAMQMIQQLQQAFEGKQMELQAKLQVDREKLLSDEKKTVAELEVDKARISGDLQIRQAELAVEVQKLELEKLKLQIELKGEQERFAMDMAKANADLEQEAMKIQAQREKLTGDAIKIAADIEKAQLEIQALRAEKDSSDSTKETNNKVSVSVDRIQSDIISIAQAIKSASQEVSGITSRVSGLETGLGALAGVLNAPKKKPKGYKLNKPDGRKTTSVVIEYDDGSTDEMPVN